MLRKKYAMSKRTRTKRKADLSFFSSSDDTSSSNECSEPLVNQRKRIFQIPPDRQRLRPSIIARNITELPSSTPICPIKNTIEKSLHLSPIDRPTNTVPTSDHLSIRQIIFPVKDNSNGDGDQRDQNVENNSVLAQTLRCSLSNDDIGNYANTVAHQDRQKSASHVQVQTSFTTSDDATICQTSPRFHNISTQTLKNKGTQITDSLQTGGGSTSKGAQTMGRPWRVEISSDESNSRWINDRHRKQKNDQQKMAHFDNVGTEAMHNMDEKQSKASDTSGSWLSDLFTKNFNENALIVLNKADKCLMMNRVQNVRVWIDRLPECRMTNQVTSDTNKHPDDTITNNTEAYDSHTNTYSLRSRIVNTSVVRAATKTKRKQQEISSKHESIKPRNISNNATPSVTVSKNKKGIFDAIDNEVDTEIHDSQVFQAVNENHVQSVRKTRSSTNKQRNNSAIEDLHRTIIQKSPTLTNKKNIASSNNVSGTNNSRDPVAISINQELLEDNRSNLIATGRAASDNKRASKSKLKRQRQTKTQMTKQKEKQEIRLNDENTNSLNISNNASTGTVSINAEVAAANTNHVQSFTQTRATPKERVNNSAVENLHPTNIQKSMAKGNSVAISKNAFSKTDLRQSDTSKQTAQLNHISQELLEDNRADATTHGALDKRRKTKSKSKPQRPTTKSKNVTQLTRRKQQQEISKNDGNITPRNISNNAISSLTVSKNAEDIFNMINNVVNANESNTSQVVHSVNGINNSTPENLHRTNIQKSPTKENSVAISKNDFSKTDLRQPATSKQSAQFSQMNQEFLEGNRSDVAATTHSASDHIRKAKSKSKRQRQTAKSKNVTHSKETAGAISVDVIGGLRRSTRTKTQRIFHYRPEIILTQRRDLLPTSKIHFSSLMGLKESDLEFIKSVSNNSTTVETSTYCEIPQKRKTSRRKTTKMSIHKEIDEMSVQRVTGVPSENNYDNNRLSISVAASQLTEIGDFDRNVQPPKPQPSMSNSEAEGSNFLRNYIYYPQNNKVCKIDWAFLPPQFTAIGDGDSLRKGSAAKSSLTGFQSGFLEILPGRSKPRDMSVKFSLLFAVLRGNGRVAVHDACAVGGWMSTYFVPLGVYYTITNLSQTDSLLLFYVKIQPREES